MADILKCCQDLENRLNNKRSLEQVFNDCARKRLIDLYNQENDEFDRLLNKLDRSIDFNSYSDVKKCVTSLIRLLGKNRKNLNNSLRRLY
jgi:hypothetical protein